MSRKSKAQHQRKQSAHQVNETGRNFVSVMSDNVKRGFERVSDEAERIGNSLREKGKSEEVVEHSKTELAEEMREPTQYDLGVFLNALSEEYSATTKLLLEKLKLNVKTYYQPSYANRHGISFFER